MTCCQVAKYFNSRYLVANGWTDHHIRVLKSLLWRHAITAEEYYGPKICTENLECSTHACEDILRHSSPDNYCCDMYERTVDDWKKQKHNSKSVEATYGERDAIRSFLKEYEAKHGKLSNPCPIESKFDYNDVQGRAFFLNEGSFAAAEKVLKELEAIENDHFVDTARSFGVLLGKLKRKRLSDVEYRDISKSFQHRFPNLRLPRQARYVTAIAKKNSNEQVQRFAKGDTCLVGGTGQYAGELFHFKIESFILVSVQGVYEIFVDGKYFVPVFNNGVLEVNPWTETVVLRERPYQSDRLQWSSQIVRKIILYPMPTNVPGNEDYVPIDFDAPPSTSCVHVPLYPLVDDNLAVRGPNNVTWYCKVLETEWQNKRARVKWYNEIRPGHLRVTNQTDYVFYRSILYQITVQRGKYGFQIV